MKEMSFTTFEYKIKIVKAEHQTRIIDMCESFGWEITTITPAVLEKGNDLLRVDFI